MCHIFSFTEKEVKKKWERKRERETQTSIFLIWLRYMLLLLFSFILLFIYYKKCNNFLQTTKDKGRTYYEEKGNEINRKFYIKKQKRPLLYVSRMSRNFGFRCFCPPISGFLNLKTLFRDMTYKICLKIVEKFKQKTHTHLKHGKSATLQLERPTMTHLSTSIRRSLIIH